MSVTFKSALLFTLAFSLIGAAVTGNAQATTPSSENDLQAAGGPNPGSATDAAAADPTPLPAAPVPQFGANATATDSWHGAVSIYGWFPGVHGTSACSATKLASAPHSAMYSTPSRASFRSQSRPTKAASSCRSIISGSSWQTVQRLRSPISLRTTSMSI